MRVLSQNSEPQFINTVSEQVLTPLYPIIYQDFNMSSPNAHTQLNICVPGGMMLTPNHILYFTAYHGNLDRQTTPSNKENTPVASLSGGDALCQAIQSPEIAGLKMKPKVVRNVFYSKKVNFTIFFVLKY
jgi:hypothetical protein